MSNNASVNRSQLIREFYTGNASAKALTAKDLAAAIMLQHKGVHITAALVSNVLASLKKKKKGKKGQRASAAPVKSDEGKNKSAVIRAYKEANPTAAPKEIAEALTKQGLDVAAQFVSTVLSNAKKKGGVVGKRGRKGTRGKNTVPAVTASLVIDPNVVLAIANDPSRWLGELGNVTDVTTLQFFCLNLMGIRLNELKQLQEEIFVLKNPPVNPEALAAAS